MRPALSISNSKFLRRAVSVLVLLGLVLSGVLLAGNVLRLERGERTKSFFTDGTDYDVLLFGSSHMLNGIYPMELWQGYGVTAYNLAGHGCRPSMSYWLLKLALEQGKKPRAAVLDVLFCWEESSELTVSLAHNILDPWPGSAAKVKAILDLYSRWPDRAELLFPLDVYHNLWKELDSSMVRYGLGAEVAPLPEKGAESRVYANSAEAFTPTRETVEEYTLEMGYVMNFIRLCQENDIVPVITYLPCDISQWSQMCCNRTLELAREAGAVTVDLQSDSPLDNRTDWADGADHANPAGAGKLTAALGAALLESVHLPDRRQEPEYAPWQEDLERFLLDREEKMRAADTPEKLLTLASNPAFTVRAELAPGYVPGETLAAQLEALGDRAEISAMASGGGALRITVLRSGREAASRSFDEILRKTEEAS